MTTKKTELEKLNIIIKESFTRGLFFNKGYDGIITLGAYFQLFEKLINPSPEYQRAYHYDDKYPDTFGVAWQRNLIGDLLKGEKIGVITLREVDEIVHLVISTTSIDMLLHELLDGGHRSTTLFNFYGGHLKTPEGLELSVNGRIYGKDKVGGKFWSELPLAVRKESLNNRFLNLDVFQNITDDEAGDKFETINDLHDMTAQEKRQHHRVQVSESIRELAAIDKTDLKMYQRKGMKFKWVNIPVIGRVTDEITATLAYVLEEGIVKTNLSDRNSYASISATKAQLNTLYINGDRQHDEPGEYHKSSKLMMKVNDIMSMISDMIYDNRTDDHMSRKYWTKSSILKFGLMIDRWMDEFGVQSIKNMNTKLFWTKLSVLLRSKMKDHEWVGKSRYHILDGKVVIERQQPNIDKELKAGFSKVWGTGVNIHDFEWLVLTIEADWNPAEWGIVKLDKRNFSEKQRQEIFANDNHACVSCGSTENCEADHIKPWEKGGRTIVENGQTLCRSCNASKSNKISNDTLQKLSDLELGDLFRNGKLTLEQMKTHLIGINAV